jgi:hypothetical protein
MMNIKGLTLAIVLLSANAQAGEISSAGPSIDIKGGLSTLSSKLDGNGFANDLGGDRGFTYDVDLSYGWEDGFRIHLKYAHANGKFDAPSGTTPALIDAARSEYKLYGTVTPFDSGWTRRFRFGVGYGVVNYVVDQNSPVVVTSQYSQGVSAMVDYDISFSDSWGVTLKALAYLPHSFTEKQVSTGFNPKYLGQEVAMQLNWQIKEDLLIYFAPSYRTDTVRFTGSGNRNVSAATDVRTTILFPLGLKLDF